MKKSLESIAIDYDNAITKVGNLSILSKVKKAQVAAAKASNAARELYVEYMKSVKENKSK